MLGAIHNHEIGRTTHFDQAAIQIAHARRIAGGKTECNFSGDVGQAGQLCNHTQNPQRLYTGTGGAVGTQNHAVQAAQFVGMTGSKNGNTLVTVMHNFNAARRALAQLTDLLVRQGSMPAVNMADNVGVGFQYHVFIDQARAGNGWTAGVNGALNTVFARPFHHFSRFVAGLYTAQANFAQQLHARIGQVFEVGLNHALFNYRRTRQHLHATWAGIFKGTL